MQNALRALCLLSLSAMLFTGCAYDTYTKTALLPLTEDTTVETPGTGSGKDWELKKIYRYEYTASSMKTAPDSLLTTVGWDGDTETLYTVNGLSGEEVTVEQVDIRYGFHETCASLGILNYRNLKLSPCGSCVIYTSPSDRDSNILEVYLYDLTDQTAILIGELPDASPFLSLDFTFSGDGKRVFFWYTTNPFIPSAETQIFLEEWVALRYAFLSDDFETDSGNLLFQVMSYTMGTEHLEVLSSLQDLFPFSIKWADLGLLSRDLCTNNSGSALLLSCYDLDSCYLVSPDTGLVCSLSELPEEDMQMIQDETAAGEVSENAAKIYESDIDPFSDLDKEKIEANRRVFGTPSNCSGLSEHYVYGLSGQSPSLLSFDFSFSSSVQTLYTSPERMTPDGLPSGDVSSRLLMTSDESHLLLLQNTESGSCSLSLYPFTVDSSDHSISLGSPKLLYQSSDPIMEITCTPDGSYLILRTQSVRSLTIDQNQYEAYLKLFEAYGYDQDSAYKIYGHDMLSELLPSQAAADYQVTILAF